MNIALDSSQTASYPLNELRRDVVRLRGTEALPRLLADLGSELLMVLDPDGVVQWAAGPARRLVGVPCDALEGRALLSLLPGDDRDRLRAEWLQPVLQGQPAVESDARLPRADGHVARLRLRGAPLFSDPSRTERVTGCVVVLSDVTVQAALQRALSISDERLRLALSGASVGVFDVAYPQLVGEFSPECHDLLAPVALYPVLRVRDLLRAMHRGDRRAAVKAWQQVAHRMDGTLQLDFRLRRPQGGYRWMRVLGRLTVVGPPGEPPCMVGSVRDFTEQQHGVQQLLETRANLAHANRMARIGSFSRSLVGESHAVWSEQALRILGVDPNLTSLGLDDYAQAIHPDDRALFRERLMLLLQMAGHDELDTRVLWSDGRQRHVRHLLRVVPGVGGTPEVLMGTLQDVTDLKRSEAELRELSIHHEDELNRERKRIATDVHDELGQQLTAMKLQLDLLRSREPLPPGLQAPLASLRELVSSTMEVARNIAMNLRPPALDMGLLAALEWLAEDFTLRSEIACEVSGEDPGPLLDERRATGLFRIAQESLSNIARHARAGSVSIHLSHTTELMRLSVRDDGCGFDPQGVPPRGHFGLFGMRERARHMDGLLRIDSRPGAGTVVLVEIPIHVTQPEGGLS